MAVAGVLLGHWIGYVAALPEPGLRAQVLARTGHSWLHMGRQIAIVAAMLGCGWHVATTLRAKRGRRGTSWRGLALVLVGVQVASYLAVEVTERVLAGAPVATLLHDNVLVLGLIAQVAVALVGAQVLRWLGRAAAWIATALAPPAVVTARPARAFAVPASAMPRPAGALCGASGLRGPPA